MDETAMKVVAVEFGVIVMAEDLAKKEPPLSPTFTCNQRETYQSPACTHQDSIKRIPSTS